MGVGISKINPYIVYVDGFNLFGKFKELKQVAKVNLKWLELKKFIETTIRKDIPNLTLIKIKYFTAMISKDKSSDENQFIYLKALKTIQNNLVL